MFFIDSHNTFLNEQISRILNQYNFHITNNLDSEYYCKIYFETKNKILIMRALNKEEIIKLPMNANELLSKVKDLVKTMSIKLNKINYFPLLQTVTFMETKFYLGNIHNKIFSSLILNAKEGVNKIQLYKLIWPKDKELQLNKLDTHLTNLKNLFKEKINLSLNIKSTDSVIQILIN